jgi:hypothetical protein
MSPSFSRITAAIFLGVGAVATALVAFALLWAAVFVQMATGNDPVLGSRATHGAVAAAAEAVETTSPEESEPESVETLPVESEPIELEPEPEPEPAPVETAQS